MELMPATKEAYQLMHDTSLAFAKMEANGIHIHVKRLNKTIENVTKKIRSSVEELRADPVFKIWTKEFGKSSNLGSRPQLGRVVFDILKYPCSKFTEKSEGERYSTSESVFENIDLPFVKKWNNWLKLSEIKGKYLNGIKKHLCGDFLHPDFNVHTAETYRGSASNPNFNAMPIRSKLAGRLIRRLFIPRDGWVLVEIDYGSLEFIIAADFWKDEAMISYASDPDKDVHGDYAAKIFLLTKNDVEKDVWKDLRYLAKNRFVFPILYGSYYLKCTLNIWEGIEKGDFKLKDGTPMKDHLSSKGITERGLCERGRRPSKGSFEYHIKEVEHDFNSGFPSFGEGKERWWQEYQKRGEFPLMTGFVIRGIYGRNFLLNAPIQGPGFHCMEWSIVEIQRWLEKYKMKSLLVGEIHDCMLLDCPENELQDVLTAAKYFMTEKIMKHWKWMIVPMKAEVDVVPVGKTWHDKEGWIQDLSGSWKSK